MNENPIINSSDVIVFVLAGFIVLCMLFGFILYFLITYKQKQKDYTLLQQQKNKIDIQNEKLEQLIVELKATQNQLIQAEKMASLGELTAGIAHEIQNPLNFVNNFAELSIGLTAELNEEIEKESLDKNLINEILSDLTNNQQKINQHGKRASNIVKGMLEHSRTSSGERRVININHLADECLRLSYHGLRAKDKTFNTTFETHFQENLPEIKVNAQEIGRVLLNLCNNAFYAVNQRKQSGEEGYQPQVSISTRHEIFQNRNLIVIEISDNGTGIPDNIKEKIFQPFFTTKPAGEGTGLGLSLSFDIITNGHNGEMIVESQDGIGTKFIIKLKSDI
ncbi:MAG: sensor histidine kinase [Saprospiraceae bacterium]